jgi:hypothetical protein
VLAIENTSSPAMYFDFRDEKHIKVTTVKEGLNNITYTCARLGRKRGLKIFSWVDLEAFSVV